MEMDCGIRKKRIATWLADELQLSCVHDAWQFVMPDNAEAKCEVRLEELTPRSLGSVDLERCKVSIEGDQSAIDAFMKLFTLRFISAGG